MKLLDSLIERVADEAKLLLITANFGANTDRDGTINIQRTKSGDDDRDRDKLWSDFGLLVHEYCHSLANPAWFAYRDNVKNTDRQGEHTLAEGVTEFLTRTVLSVVNLADKQLRQRVEGSLFDESLEPQDSIIRAGHYDMETKRAEQLVGVVGINNVYAAYFLGQTQLLGP